LASLRRRVLGVVTTVDSFGVPDDVDRTSQIVSDAVIEPKNANPA
jgi:hypothetical protein